MGPGETGDCEDFALTKMQELINKGFPVKNLQLADVATEKVLNHAVLIIHTTNRGTLVLDNRYENVLEKSAMPYRFIGYQRAGTDWAYFNTQLTGVEINYMNCHAAAFADGDQVVVKFTGQDFAQPKVIGFRGNPAGCLGGSIFFTSSFIYPWDKFYGWSYDIGLEKFNKTAELLAQPTIYAACGTPNNGQTVNFTAGDIDAYNIEPDERNQSMPINYEYTPNLDSWAIKAEMGDKRSHHICFSFSGSIHVFGGQQRTGPFSVIIISKNEKFTPSTNTWAYKADTTATYHMAEFVLSGMGYILGGNTSVSFYEGITDAVRKYDPIGNIWTVKNSLPKSVTWPAAFEDFKTNKGYFTGGLTLGQWGWGYIEDDRGLYRTERCYEFDPVANTWTRKTDLSTHGCEGSYYEFEEPPGWYINPDDCQDWPGMGVFRGPATGGHDSGLVVQNAVSIGGGLYHVLKTQEYKPSTDTWDSKNQVPEVISPFYAFSGGCGCAF